MKTFCFGCSVEKDMSVLESSPFADADGLTDQPIEPLLVLDCQGDYIDRSINSCTEWRRVVVCHKCFHALEPDMWISKDCWKQINPDIPYENLPICEAGVFEVSQLKPLERK